MDEAGSTPGRMRIALIAPPWLPVPPTGYGGTEAVVDRLATGLQALGHDVLLFTTGDSTCPVPRAWVRDRSVPELLGQSIVEAHHLVNAYERVADFDIVHDHTLLGPLLAPDRVHSRLVVTNHGPYDAEATDIFARMPADATLVAISHDQASRAPVPVGAVIHHGLRPEEFPVGDGAGGYLLFLGRFAPDKGVREAAEIARAAGVPLLIAAKMREPEEVAYFNDEIAPVLDDDIRYLGEVAAAEKLALIGSARALLNPLRWPEPFGLVMIEALACGTPVLTRRAGAAPEIVDHGVTGFVCDTDEELIAAVGAVDELDRADCRRAVMERFTTDAMVAAHVELYRQVLANAERRERAAAPAEVHWEGQGKAQPKGSVPTLPRLSRGSRPARGPRVPLSPLPPVDLRAAVGLPLPAGNGSGD